MNLSDIRHDYSKDTLSRKDLLASPFKQFEKWYQEAKGILEPNGMQLATSYHNKPSLRTVLLKGFDENGFLFFTHYTSRKGRELEENSQACLLFWWKELERQVILEGPVVKTSVQESVEYFSKRPRKSQTAAACMPQDLILNSRADLESAYLNCASEHKDQEIPLPSTWGGYRLIPERFEFWQGRESRLHDRFQYTLQNNAWIINRLSP